MGRFNFRKIKFQGRPTININKQTFGGEIFFFIQIFTFSNQFSISFLLFQAYVKAVNSGVSNIQSVLLTPEAQKQLIPIGKRVLHHSTKSKKTIDTEDTDLTCKAQPDGTLVTESKKVTEHEVLIDEDLPEADDNSTGSREKIDHKVCGLCLYYKLCVFTKKMCLD